MIKPARSKNCMGLNYMVVIILSISLLSLTGCEPLRKKFIRKKKDTNKTKFIPILDPIDYPATMNSPETKYKHFYSIWQVWHREMQEDVNLRKPNDKELMYSLNQMRDALTQMQGLVTGQKKELLIKQLSRLQGIEAEVKKPLGIRNVYAMKKSLEALGKDLRHELKYTYVQDYFIESNN